MNTKKNISPLLAIKNRCVCRIAQSRHTPHMKIRNDTRLRNVSSTGFNGGNQRESKSVNYEILGYTLHLFVFIDCYDSLCNILVLVIIILMGLLRKYNISKHQGHLLREQ